MGKRAYVIDLVRYVVEDNMSIREAAEKVGISYSWARETLNNLTRQGVIERSIYRKGKGYDQFVKDNQ
ncbi:MAG: hypothetical protein [Caudoviricetes sp.]|nr:MAG: hypothetical protein [Caudoviricetes sp.]